MTILFLIQLAEPAMHFMGSRRIMEMADGIAINKCDGSNIDKARVARTQFQNALHLFPAHESGWAPDVVTCSAVENTGIAEVWNMVENYVGFVKANHYFEHRRNSQSKYWMYESINEYLKNNFYQNAEIQKLLIKNEKRVLNNEISSFIAAKELLDAYFKS